MLLQYNGVTKAKYTEVSIVPIIFISIFTLSSAHYGYLFSQPSHESNVVTKCDKRIMLDVRPNVQRLCKSSVVCWSKTRGRVSEGNYSIIGRLVWAYGHW